MEKDKKFKDEKMVCNCDFEEKLEMLIEKISEAAYTSSKIERLREDITEEMLSRNLKNINFKEHNFQIAEFKKYIFKEDSKQINNLKKQQEIELELKKIKLEIKEREKFLIDNERYTEIKRNYVLRIK